MAQPDIVILDTDSEEIQMIFATTFSCNICHLPKPNTERHTFRGSKGIPKWAMICITCGSLLQNDARGFRKVRPGKLH